MVLDDHESDCQTLLQKANMSTLQIVRVKVGLCHRPNQINKMNFKCGNNVHN